MISNLFFIMCPFFIFFGFFFFFMSFFLCSMKLSMFFNWTFIYSSFLVNFPLYLDYISSLFMGMVLLISGSIIFYSEFYMSSEIYKSRFFYLMFLFVVSMVFLIICPNVFCMLMGWDGLGIISYCLVIYYQNYSSFCSGMITALTNRIGDVFILASIGLFFSLGEWSYMNFLNYELSKYLIFFFCIASMTKSAQIPFSAWLPAAMAAPTPVSSLVHSSTLVTAGVYILIRFNYFITEELKEYLMFISLLTMVMSGMSGMFEYDLKKIIALSTLSQLGFMMSTISLGFSDLAFFHLVTHAGFKALLFMCAGMFIHMFFDNQDIRGFGLMKKDFSFSLCMFNVGNLSLCGFPFLSGFFSKDLILEMVLMKNLNFFFFFLFTFGTFLTVFYSFRLFIYLTFKNVFFFVSIQNSLKDFKIHYSMFILYMFSISLGFVGSSLMFFPYNYICIPLILKTYILNICLLSLSLCLILSKMSSVYINKLIFFLSNMWFLGFLKTDFLKGLVLKFCYSSTKVSVGYIESFWGLKGISNSFSFSLIFSKSLKNVFYLFFFSFFMFNIALMFMII
uniref:NADH-ubiquinone oxidoreductase chain 5 n=1 Tax=Scirtothrips dorsalis TaxID=163899 RepID=A0A089N4J4_SCIDO|nr:NADH dehydrogenase subunit 5 [Scirtothrips dorsalis]AIQ81003.1 NADH dehydrogenase subunit 5 [Scirtothrips dorsalis]